MQKSGQEQAFHTFPLAVHNLTAGRGRSAVGFLETAPTYRSFSAGRAGCGQFGLTPARSPGSLWLKLHVLGLGPV